MQSPYRNLHPDFFVPGRKPIGPVAQVPNKSSIGRWLFNGAGDVAHDLNGRYNGSLSAPAAFTEHSALGRCVGLSSATESVVDLGDISEIDTATKLTVICEFVLNDTSADHALLTKAATWGTSSPLLMWFDSDGRSSVETFAVLITTTGGMVRIEGPSYAITAGNKYVAAFTYEANVSTGLRIYLDGIEVASPVNTIGKFGIKSTAEPAVIGKFSPVNGWVGDLVIESRVWSAEEIANHSADPYSNLISTLPDIIPSVSGGGLVVTDPTAQADADLVTLQQAHTLAANDPDAQGDVDTGVVSQTHLATTTDSAGQAEADLGAIQQTHLLTAEDPAGFAAPDSVAISTGGSHILTVDDSDAQAEVGGAIIAQAHQLTGEDASAQAEADTATAIQNHQVATTETTGQSDADLGTIQQTHILTVEDPAGFAAPNSVAVTQGGTHILAVDDATAQGDADAVAAQQTHQLTAQENTAQADADTVAIAQVHQPVAADAEGQATMDALGITQTHVLAALDPNALTDAEIVLAGIGPISNPRSINITPLYASADVTPTYSTEPI